jgi:hypothetical protein
MSKLMIFQHILPECEEGSPEAWRALVKNYTSTALGLWSVYSGWPQEARVDAWREALRALSANHGAMLKSFSHQSEREFLVGLRAFLQDWAAARLESSQDAADPPAPTLDSLGALLNALPLIHQEIAFLALAGYSLATIEKILRITPAVAKEGLERLRASDSSVFDRHEDRCLWPAAWVDICRTARGGEQTDCTPLRQLVRILDGQASWYDKSPAETHRAKCLHCLELWTSLLEVAAWDRMRQPWPSDHFEALLKALPLKPEKRKPSLFSRMLGK